MHLRPAAPDPVNPPAARRMTDLAAQLQVVVSDALARDVAVEELHQLTGGASRQTWSFDAVTRDGARRPLILRRDPPEAPTEGMSVEARAIRAARAAGVPEPEIVAFGDDPAALDAPFIVMERLEGETLARRILRDEQFAAVRPRLGGEGGGDLRGHHSIPVEEVPGLDRPDVLAGLRRTFAAYDDAS